MKKKENLLRILVGLTMASFVCAGTAFAEEPETSGSFPVDFITVVSDASDSMSALDSSSSTSDSTSASDSSSSTSDSTSASGSSSSTSDSTSSPPDSSSNSSDSLESDLSTDKIEKSSEDLIEKGTDGAYWDWENTNGTKMRYRENGVDITNTWKTLWGARYYFGADGYAVAGEQQRIDGNTYNFSDDFTLQTGLYRDWYEENAPYCWVNPSDFSLLKNHWNNLGSGQMFWFDENGHAVSGVQRIDGAAYTFYDDYRVMMDTLYRDWYEENAPYRYFDSRSLALLRNSWLDTSSGRYYFNEKGVSEKGWKTIDGERYYFNDSFAAETGSQKRIDDTTYNFDVQGKLETGLYRDWYVEGAPYCWINPVDFSLLKNHWNNLGNGQMFWFDGTGHTVKGLQRIDGESYMFCDDFTLMTNELYRDWYIDDAPYRWVVAEDFSILKNHWNNLGNGRMFWFDETGHAVKGTYRIDNVTYVFRDDFTLLTNELYRDWYEDGAPYRYILSSSLQPIKNSWLTVNNTKFYFNENGISITGWLKSGNNYYFFDRESFAGLTGNQRINDIAYNFNTDGSLRTGELYWDWAYDGGRLRYIVPGTNQLHKGWLLLGGAGYYFDENGLSVKGSQRIDGAAYNFNNNFTLRTGELYWDWAYDGGRLRYVDPGTVNLHKGWLLLSGAGYYFDANGLSVRGSQRIDSVAYNFNDNFTLRTGELYWDWAYDGGRLRYVDPGTINLHKGWLDISGARYYFDASGLSVKGTVTVDGKLYVFDDNFQLLSELVKGIDVSSHQGLIDWNQVKASGIQFAIIRAMSWPANGSYYQMDPYFLTNIKNARAAGIYVGAYWFSYAFNGQEAIEEVTFINNSSEWNELKKQGIVLDLPFFIDYEYSDQKHGEYMNANTTYASRTEAVRNGMVYTENVLGCRPGFYGSYNDITKWYDGLGLINEGYDCWVAQWGSTNSLGDKADIWQYSSTASVPGIKGNVDVNYCYNQDYFDSIRVYDQALGTNVQGNVQTILARLVEQEVGGMNNAEVYKAQTIAANTYIRYLLKQGKTPSVRLSARVPSSLVRGAVAAVKDELVYYNNELALTVYGSSSADTTNKAYTYGWVELPYLTNVDNKYDTQYKNMTCYVKNSDLEKGIKALGGSTEGYDPSNWIQGCVFDQYGWLKSITLCGKTYTAEQFYENSWGLYSTNFKSFTYDSANSRWVFTGVNGNGHGIGMSQYGAKGMADAGYNYKQILNHYYPGTVII